MAAGKSIAGCPPITGQPEAQLTGLGRKFWPRVLAKTMIQWAKEAMPDLLRGLDVMVGLGAQPESRQ